MVYIDFLSSLKKTKRDYIGRVIGISKADAASIAKQFGYDYWDGDRKFGYGGYRYDERWKPIAEMMINYYGLKKGDKILDVGCGKGFLLYELKKFINGLEIFGIDISEYAIENAKEEIKDNLRVGNATELPYNDKTFDLVISINTLHNLKCFDLEKSIHEIERVGKKNKYIVVESYRNEVEKMNLLYWQLTCESFYSTDSWEWWFKKCGYTGDYSFIFFE